MEVAPWSDSCLPCYRHISLYQKRHQHLTPDNLLRQARAVSSSACRRDEWIRAGVAEPLRLAVLGAYDRLFG
jgi:hypothetical protein